MAKILIIDDDAFMRRLIQQILRQAGYEIVIAVDGQDGIEKVSSEKPDLVIMDQNMPNMDGSEALRILRADPASQSLPVIIASASLDDEITVKLKLAGASGFVSKPIQVQQLLPLIQQFLS